MSGAELYHRKWLWHRYEGEVFYHVFVNFPLGSGIPTHQTGLLCHRKPRHGNNNDWQFTTPPISLTCDKCLMKLAELRLQGVL